MKPLSAVAVGIILLLTSCGQTTLNTATPVSAIVDVCIENATAADVLAHSRSTFKEGSASYLDSDVFRQLRSTALDHGYRNDQPNTFTVNFSRKESKRAEVTMATDPHFIHVVLSDEVALANGHGSFRLGNFVPGHTYYYKVTDGKHLLASGAIQTTGQLRMIRIDNSWNIRDLGGWKGWGGNAVRYEWIYRGGSLGGQDMNHQTYFLPTADIDELHRLGIRAHLDLRAEPGQGAWPTDEKLNAYTLGYTPLRDAEFANITTDFALYNAKANTAAVDDVAWVIQQVRKGNPVYFHCRTGADRTGVVGMTLLTLLGCDEQPSASGGNQVAIDYELTSLGMDEQGTIAYNTTGIHPNYYSNRYANTIATSSYNYFRTLRSLQPDSIVLTDMQQRCYYYLNRYFLDNDVQGASRASISKDDLDWFINFMLGITDHNGQLLPGHTTRFVGPEWGVVRMEDKR